MFVIFSGIILQGDIFQILFFAKIPSGEQVATFFRPFQAKKQKSKILDFSGNFLSLGKGRIFLNSIFRKLSFRRVSFNVCSTFLHQKTKIENFENFPIFKSRKSPPRGKFFKFYFFGKNLQESRFQHISDHFRMKNKNRKF